MTRLRRGAPADRLRIVVLGYLVRGPFGGMAWHHLQYVLGLTQLGHDVLFVEDSDDYASCYDPSRRRFGVDPTFGLAFTAHAFTRLALPACWAYYDAHRDVWHGPRAGDAAAFCAAADLVINVSAVNPLRAWCERVPVRVLLDTDPVFTQIRHVTTPAARARALAHTAFFTFGENVGVPGTLPDDGLPWQPTRQPICLDVWPVRHAPRDGRFTTVMQWDSYPAREYDGQRYGMKSDSFAPYLDLPARTGPVFALAVGGPTAPCERLAALGWGPVDPCVVADDPWAYQAFIRRSKGEFGVAKHGYVVCRSGWFSERSAAYLASGRPVVAQDTGFSDHVPTGTGLLAFTSPDGAVAAIEDVDRRYDAHCAAARAIAVEHFDARVVLASLVERAFARPSTFVRAEAFA